MTFEINEIGAGQSSSQTPHGTNGDGGSPAAVATLFVHLDDAGTLHWKASMKGSRWNNSKSASISEVCRQAEKHGMPDRYEIDYVEQKD